MQIFKKCDRNNWTMLLVFFLSYNKTYMYSTPCHNMDVILREKDMWYTFCKKYNSCFDKDLQKLRFWLYNTSIER